MKIAFALILCGLSCVWASDSCPDYPQECAKTEGQEYGEFPPETDAGMEDFCKYVPDELDCQLNFTERCPNTLLGAFRESLKEYRRVFGKLCDKSNPLRQKYLEKAACLNEKTKEAELKCEKIVTVQEYCKRNTELLNCTEKEINNMCGGDGEEVIAELFKPKHKSLTVFCGTQ